MFITKVTKKKRNLPSLFSSTTIRSNEEPSKTHSAYRAINIADNKRSLNQIVVVVVVPPPSSTGRVTLLLYRGNAVNFVP